MSLPLSPRTRLAVTSPVDDEVLNALLAALQWQEGEQFVYTAAAQNVTAGVTLTAAIQPPIENKGEEWLVLFAHVADGANIDAADAVEFRYSDTLTSLTVLISRAVLVGSTQGNIATYPVIAGISNIPTTAALPVIPIRLRRRDNGEPWRQLAWIYIASGTVGTRSVSPRALIVRRLL